MNAERLNASSRVALAAYLHDLGKFAERARIENAKVKDSQGLARIELEKQLNCHSFNGRYTHIHAAYTAIGFDLLEEHLPELVGEQMEPFGPWRERNADDSIINAAARHHNPGTYLQWIVASADRLASGFEREEFDKYNASADEEEQQQTLNHYTKRQLTLLEQVRLQPANGERPKYRFLPEATATPSGSSRSAGFCRLCNDPATQPAVGLGLHLRQHLAGLAVRRLRHRSLRPPHRRLAGQPVHAHSSF